MRIKENLGGSLFILPWLFGFLAFVAYPLIFSVYMSFNYITVSGDGSGLDYQYRGWHFYKFAFIEDNEFPFLLYNFFLDSAVVIPLTVLFALLIAIVLNQKFPGRMIFRTIFFLPVIFASGQVLEELIFAGQGSIPIVSEYDVMDTIYRSFPTWAADLIGRLLNQLLIIIWYSGVQIVIFLAAFQTIPRTTYEAAQIDGATPWESFWKISFPAIVPFIVLNLIYTIVDASTSVTNPMIVYIARAVNNTELGYAYAAAIGWIYSVIIFIPIVILVFAFRKQTLGKRE